MQLRTRFRRALYKILRVVRVRDRPNLKPTNDTLRPERRLTLCDLPTEVLEHILYITDEWKYLRLPSVSRLSSPLLRGISTPLKDLSTVNRQLHALCCPMLFRLIQLDPSGTLPPSVLQHVRCMHVNLPASPSWVITEDFMLQPHRLERVFWHGAGKLVPLSHLRILLASPSLHTLSLSNVWLQADATDLSTVVSRLRTLRIDFSRQVQNGTPIFADIINPNLDCLGAVFYVLRPRLESLTLSGYSARLSSLAAAPWPSLRAFSLTRGDAILDVPWATLLTQMPKLSSFTVALDRGETPTIIFPDAVAADTNPLPALHHLTISFPHPDDPLFSSLPFGLRELSLRDTPRYYNSRSRWREESDYEPILSCPESPDVLRILAVLLAESLTALELVYLEDEEEFRMLALLTKACPNLTLLELHRYPARPGTKDAWYHGTLSIPVDALADALSAFKSLRVLKLNLCITKPDVLRHLGALPVDYWDRLYELLESHARTVALRVPWITQISFLAGSMHGMHWDTWSLFPVPSKARDLCTRIYITRPSRAVKNGPSFSTSPSRIID